MGKQQCGIERNNNNEQQRLEAKQQRRTGTEEDIARQLELTEGSQGKDTTEHKEADTHTSITQAAKRKQNTGCFPCVENSLGDGLSVYNFSISNIRECLAQYNTSWKQLNRDRKMSWPGPRPTPEKKGSDSGIELVGEPLLRSETSFLAWLWVLYYIKKEASLPCS